MCDMNELVQLVPDHELGPAQWVAAVADDGRRMVFVKESCEPLLSQYCATGEDLCPIRSALRRMSPTAA